MAGEAQAGPWRLPKRRHGLSNTVAAVPSTVSTTPAPGACRLRRHRGQAADRPSTAAAVCLERLSAGPGVAPPRCDQSSGRPASCLPVCTVPKTRPCSAHPFPCTAVSSKPSALQISSQGIQRLNLNRGPRPDCARQLSGLRCAGRRSGRRDSGCRAQSSRARPPSRAVPRPPCSKHRSHLPLLPAGCPVAEQRAHPLGRNEDPGPAWHHVEG